jgi:hypothetical protein
MRHARPTVLSTFAASLAALAAATTACSSAPEPSSDGEESSGALSAAPAQTATSTTRTQLTANNTSASDLFTDQYTPAARFFGANIGLVTRNGDNVPGSVTASSLTDGAISKISLHTLLPAGAKTKILYETQSWFCTNGVSPLASALGKDQCGSHIDIGYSDGSAAQIEKQVADMRSRGADGAIVDWEGAGDGAVAKINNAALASFKSAAEASGGAFVFAVSEDESAKATAAANGGDWTQAVITDLTYLSDNHDLGSPAYYRVGGRPVVFVFGVDGYAYNDHKKTVDWDKVAAEAPGSPLLVFENTAGHAKTFGAYAWPKPVAIGSYPAAPDPFDISYLKDFYPAAKDFAVVFGMAYKGFDDHVVNGWVGPTTEKPDYSNGRRYSGQQCGKTWLDSFAVTSAVIDEIAAVQLPTWDDYEEATELETGIDNHLALSPKISGSTLSWSLTADKGAPADCSGVNLATTVHHFAVYASPATDGENLTLVADDIAPSALSLDLTGKLPAGKYVLYVRAVGQPSITNKLSPAIAFTSAGGGGGGGSGDAGTCSGVPTILEPTASEDVGPSIHLRVSAPSCIETMIPYLDGKALPVVTGDSIDEWVPVTLGTHTLNVNGWAGTDTAHASAHVTFTRTY